MIFASPVWHFWIAVVLMVTMVVPATIAVVALYLKKVVRPQYPSAKQKQG